MRTCPNCGSEHYYVKMNFSGSGNFNYRFDGKEADNSEMHDGIRYSYGKFAYCVECNKRLFKVDDDGMMIT